MNKRRITPAEHIYPGVFKIDEFLPAAASGFREGLDIYGLRAAAVAVGFRTDTVSSSRTRCVRNRTLIKIGTGKDALYKYNDPSKTTQASLWEDET